MTENSVVIKYLKQLGYNPRTDYYQNINLWKSWYENNVPSFHEYHDQNGDLKTIHKLGMAKRLCEDWSSILYTERDEIKCHNERNQKYIDEKIKEVKFSDVLSDNIETAFWSGTVGTITRIKNAKVKGKKIIADENTYMELVSVNASQIIPLKIDNGRIIDVAFVSETVIENESVYYIEIHELKENGYVIKNIYINEKGEPRVNEKVPDEYETNTRIPIFNLLMPRIVNNIENNNGLGISVYANAIDQLEVCDTVYNNFYTDFYLGGKKVFYNRKLTKYQKIKYKDNETGEEIVREIPIYPDDITKQQFQVLGDDFDTINDKALIQEHNPDLREEDNENGLNFALNILAFKGGLGKDYYKFENGKVITATQALIDNRDLTGNAKKHRSAVNDYAVGIIRSILLLGKLIFKEKLDENDEISLIDKDGFLISEEELKQQYLNEIASGIRQEWEYRVKFFGEDEATAKRIIENNTKENEESDEI